MSIFNFVSNYKKAKEYDELKSSIDALNKYISYSLVKPILNDCIILEDYKKDIFKSSECSELLSNFKTLNTDYYFFKSDNMKLKCDKLKVEVELLKMKLK